MSRTKRINPQMSIRQEDIRRIMIAYHFDEADCSRFWNLYQAMLPLLDPMIIYRTEEVSLYPAEPGYVDCVVTLGDGIDQLVALYESHQAISDAYLVDCMGSGLLEVLYHQLADVIEKETGWVVSSYQFPGTHMAIEEMKNMIDRMTADGMKVPVEISDSYVISPSKSVVMRAVLESKKQENTAHCIDLCRDCPKENCTHRKGKNAGRSADEGKAFATGKAGRNAPENLNYGYKRIFGS